MSHLHCRLVQLQELHASTSEWKQPCSCRHKMHPAGTLASRRQLQHITSFRPAYLVITDSSTAAPQCVVRYSAFLMASID
jgi:hypothetical protein